MSYLDYTVDSRMQMVSVIRSATRLVSDCGVSHMLDPARS